MLGKCHHKPSWTNTASDNMAVTDLEENVQIRVCMKEKKESGELKEDKEYI